MAFLKDPASGRTMKIVSCQPGLQFYDSSSLVPQRGKGGCCYLSRAGLCLETQNIPDAVNHPLFPDAVLPAGKKYCVTTSFIFSVT